MLQPIFCISPCLVAVCEMPVNFPPLPLISEVEFVRLSVMNYCEKSSGKLDCLEQKAPLMAAVLQLWQLRGKAALTGGLLLAVCSFNSHVR